MKKILLLVGILTLGAMTFAANGTGVKQGNRQPNGKTRMEANGGICTVTGTTTRGNVGTFQGAGVKSGNPVNRNGKGAGVNVHGVAGRNIARTTTSTKTAQQ